MFPLSDSIPARRFPILNLLIIAATVFVFVQQLFSPDPEAFIQAYALVPSSVHFNDVITLLPFVTAIFLHGGFLHIISNMWFLWVFGDNVEGTAGFLLYPVTYFAAGIAGNIVQYSIFPTSSIPMLGASGAVAGVLGAYYVLFPHAKIKTLVPIFGFVTIAEISAPFMLGYWFVLQIFSGVASVSAIATSFGGIAFFAHVAGFITGVLIARVFIKSHD